MKVYERATFGMQSIVLTAIAQGGDGRVCQDAKEGNQNDQKVGSPLQERLQFLECFGLENNIINGEHGGTL